jgi:DNA-binding transcriptional ArsR family regulator
MPTRWDITKAVRASSLPAPARLVMFVLCDVAVVGTAEIPERFTPSVSVLERETGLSRSTVQRYLASLEADGWIARSRPATPQAMWAGERVRYRLTVPDGVVAEPDEVVSQEDHPGITETPGVVSRDDEGGITATPLETDLSDHDQIKSDQTTSAISQTPPHRPDVEKICNHLADRIVENGSKRPTITAKWLTDARLLLDKDGRTVEQVIRAIDWCQNDAFWRANIRSMPTLREKYDTLRLQAQRPTARASPLVEHNGLRLRPETVERLEAHTRFEAMDAARARTAIEGTAS